MSDTPSRVMFCLLLSVCTVLPGSCTSSELSRSELIRLAREHARRDGSAQVLVRLYPKILERPDIARANDGEFRAHFRIGSRASDTGGEIVVRLSSSGDLVKVSAGGYGHF
jgi:hypothetical protein